MCHDVSPRIDWQKRLSRWEAALMSGKPIEEWSEKQRS